MIFRHAQEMMKQLTPEMIASVASNTLYTKAEERLLAEIPSKVHMLNDIT